MAVSHDQIKELLGQGLAAEVVASAVGCTASYISQLLSDEEFSADVARLKIESLAKHNRTDNKLATLEETLLDNLIDDVVSKRIYKPHDVLKTFAVINAAKRRGASSTNSSNAPSGGVVQLTIPVHIVQQFTMDSRKEVVAVGEKSMVTIAPEKLLGMLKAEAGSEIDTTTYTKLLGRMPSAVTINRDGKVE